MINGDDESIQDVMLQIGFEPWTPALTEPQNTFRIRCERKGLPAVITHPFL